MESSSASCQGMCKLKINKHLLNSINFARGSVPAVFRWKTMTFYTWHMLKFSFVFKFTYYIVGTLFVSTLFYFNVIVLSWLSQLAVVRQVHIRTSVLPIHLTCNVNKQLLDEVEHDIMNYQSRGLCYLPKPKAEADNTDTRGLVTRQTLNLTW